MITIVNKYTGDIITTYSGASVSYATKDSFVANAKGSYLFRRRWNALVYYYIPTGRFVQCLLKEPYAVKECL